MDEERRFVGEIYRRLRERFGFRDWWPGDSALEILVGAILTQQTSWGNVEKAIGSLKARGMLSLEGIAGSSVAELGEAIRPSGYYRQKAARLIGVCRRIRDEYGTLESFFALGTDELRRELLSMKGIGNETADSILLYAAGRPVFVVDAYTMRIMRRLSSGFEGKGDYESFQRYFMSNTRKSAELYNDFHAQLVELGKRHCKTRPVCKGCPLEVMCGYAGRHVYNIHGGTATLKKVT